MASGKAYNDFIKRLKLLIRKNPQLITTTLSNIFTMRLIGNKTHGDLAEIAISEFINQYMYDFRSDHVGKDLFRAKSREEDINVTNQISGEEFPVSLKAYGKGPLQLSTDKKSLMFSRLQTEKANIITGKRKISTILNDPAFAGFSNVNVLPLIYDEKEKKCGIFVFKHDEIRAKTVKIEKMSADKVRKHPVYRFLDASGICICEVRHGGAAANALQRGLWTHTVNAAKYFDSVTGGWISYSHNQVLVRLFSHALVASQGGHDSALESIKKDIKALKSKADL